MKTCHPERRNCVAKRSNFGVEQPALSLPKGPLQAGHGHGRFGEFSREPDLRRENALERLWQCQGYRDPFGKLRAGSSTARDFASRTLAPLRMTISNNVMCNQ